MAFSWDYSEELELQIAFLKKRDKKLAEILKKKMDEIISCEENTIEHYKNLRHNLSDCKRVRIGKSFVLMFKVFKKEKFIFFDKFDHHDNIYKH